MKVKERAVRLAIVGGGASGMAAAIQAKRNFPQLEITVFEKTPRVGRKIAASGNGRCNLTNRNLSPEFYHGGDPRFVSFALELFGLESTREFFAGLGIPLRFEADRAYPYSLTASSVSDALRHELGHICIKFSGDTNITNILKTSQGFELITDSRRFEADAVIIAAGGAASPSLGGGDGGYRLLRALGHGITEILPSVVQVESASRHATALDGIRVFAQASLINCSLPFSERDEVLFTKYGLSGPAVMQLSGRCAKALLNGEKPSISLNLFPEMPESELFSELTLRAEKRGWLPLEEFLGGLLHKKVGMMALKAAGIGPLSRESGTLSKDEINKLTGILRGWEFGVTKTRGIESAQVTAGGAQTRSFDPATMESRLVPGLYACGEVLDIDGDCGGYNLQWAWSSGRLAGQSASEKLKETR